MQTDTMHAWVHARTHTYIHTLWYELKSPEEFDESRGPDPSLLQ